MSLSLHSNSCNSVDEPGNAILMCHLWESLITCSLYLISLHSVSSRRISPLWRDRISVNVIRATGRAALTAAFSFIHGHEGLLLPSGTSLRFSLPMTIVQTKLQCSLNHSLKLVSSLINTHRKTDSCCSALSRLKITNCLTTSFVLLWMRTIH